MIVTRDRNKIFANQKRPKDWGIGQLYILRLAFGTPWTGLSVRKSKTLSASVKIGLSQAKF